MTATTEFACDICGYVYPTQADLDAHIRAAHDTNGEA